MNYTETIQIQVLFHTIPDRFKNAVADILIDSILKSLKMYYLVLDMVEDLFYIDAANVAQ